VRAFKGVGGTPFFTQSAKGATLTTVDGQTLTDLVGTWGPAIHGHADPDIQQAVAEALERGTSFGTPSPAEVEMAELIVELVPSVEQVRLCNSGTEATMSAIRLARGFTGKNKVIKFAGCYHGHVDSLLVAAGSGALTLGYPDSAGVPASFAQETLVLPLDDLGAVARCLDAYAGQVAAIIIEPYPANCGLLLPHSDYLAGLRELCTRHGVLLIFDEVMTGFRLGLGGVQGLTGVTPDLTALGKIIGGGLPVGAFGGRAEVMAQLAPLGPVYQAGTLSGNPLAMAAGLTSLKKLQAGGTALYAQLDAHGQQIANALTTAANSRGIPLQVPQAGSMFSLFFSDGPVRAAQQATASDIRHFKALFHTALEGGVYLPPSPFETCFLSTAHQAPDIDRICTVLATAVSKL
jgi:glutamate-1-semialdehyde 2,1-aminomutase